jgi:hypothetical protein
MPSSRRASLNESPSLRVRPISERVFTPRTRFCVCVCVCVCVCMSDCVCVCVCVCVCLSVSQTHRIIHLYRAGSQVLLHLHQLLGTTLRGTRRLWDRKFSALVLAFKHRCRARTVRGFRAACQCHSCAPRRAEKVDGRSRRKRADTHS